MKLKELLFKYSFHDDDINFIQKFDNTVIMDIDGCEDFDSTENKIPHIQLKFDNVSFISNNFSMIKDFEILNVKSNNDNELNFFLQEINFLTKHFEYHSFSIVAENVEILYLH